MDYIRTFNSEPDENPKTVAEMCQFHDLEDGEIADRGQCLNWSSQHGPNSL